jgi:hypothetical protein
LAGISADRLASPLITRYTRRPSITVESKLSLRRLQITPARKPRTECCCQLVAFINASRVVPLGERNISIAVDCFVPARLGSGLDSFLHECFEFDRLRSGREGVAVRFLEDFAIWIPLRLERPLGPHHRSPAVAVRRAGHVRAKAVGRRTRASSAPFAQQCQSNLYYFVAHSGASLSSAFGRLTKKV